MMKKNKNAFFLTVVAVFGALIMTACDGNGDGESQVPEAPTIVNIYLNNRELAILWATVENADSYNLYWNTTGGVSKSDNSFRGLVTDGDFILYYHSGLSLFKTYSYRVSAVNTVGESTLSNELSEIPAVTPVQLLKRLASDAEDDDNYGSSVALSGDFAIVGAPSEDGVGTDRGAAYVCNRNSGGENFWEEVVKLTASDAADGDEFGCSVSISGDYAVVGSHSEDGSGVDRGAAYVYGRNHGGDDNWGQMAILTASDTQDGDEFGCSVSISGDYVVVGALFKDDAGSDRGAAYVFYRDQGGADNWGQIAKLTASDAADSDHFGNSVAISGDYVVVGVYHEDGGGTDYGAAYVYGRNHGGDDSWGQMAKLTASDAADGDEFGCSVSISGDLAAVGAMYEDGEGTDQGAVYIYDRNQGGTDSWGEVTKLTNPDAVDDDGFGNSVSIDGDHVLIGALNDDGDGTDRGAAYIYGRNIGGTDNWGGVMMLTPSDPADGDLFGFSVAIQGDFVVVGAPFNYGLGTFRGAIYIF